MFGNTSGEGVNGLMMNHEAYTAYPSEGELLLMEGVRQRIFAVERGFKIENMNKSMELYNGKTITIVCLQG